MTDKVVDACALAAILFGEPQSENMLARLDGHRLFAPSLLPYEIASIARKKLRLYPDMRATILDAIDRFDRMDITFEAVPPDQAFLVAAEFGITTYDACYLWLSRVQAAELVTLDKLLQRAATGENL